ncbi:hypothetical protein RRG08_048381 [Elysia crispata]|uniref:Uncharacterized protein n=1 Tax=Elysia crispata TaxID=231223 RepID=A0AAE1EBS0_9GAST|nr:hypothetical protein RRG08_048381 [Elysia crispata]
MLISSHVSYTGLDTSKSSDPASHLVYSGRVGLEHTTALVPRGFEFVFYLSPPPPPPPPLTHITKSRHCRGKNLSAKPLAVSCPGAKQFFSCKECD